ncbi:MAG TPA: hypothetical protein VGO11_11215 [Chthoniobacteraceae bacterium]|jgi:hypothetical protein|nr:hypothetical protein [Chthoniobacteraceae bacterium]
MKKSPRQSGGAKVAPTAMSVDAAGHRIYPERPRAGEQPRCDPALRHIRPFGVLEPKILIAVRNLSFRKYFRFAFSSAFSAMLLAPVGCVLAEEEEASTAPFLRTPASFVYVLRPWHFALEESYTATLQKDPREWGSALGSELEIGLPRGAQVGVNLELGGDSHRRFRRTGESVELRWALAELFHMGAGHPGWGAWWGNPVLFGEWQFREHEPDAGEVRLLFSDDFAHHRWFWTANLFYEREVTEDRETECGLTGALLCRFPAQRVSAGAEFIFTRSTDKDRRHPELSFVIGPSFLLEPFEHCEFKFAPLFGCTDSSPSVSVRALLEFEF